MICPHCGNQYRPAMPYRYATATRIVANLPEHLRIERARQSLTLRQVAERAGLSIPAVSRAEQGHHTSTATTLAILRWLAGGS